jgi:hypothetical protein
MELDAFHATQVFCISYYVLVQAVLRAFRRKRSHLVFYPDGDGHFLSGVTGFDLFNTIVDSPCDRGIRTIALFRLSRSREARDQHQGENSEQDLKTLYVFHY